MPVRATSQRSAAAVFTGTSGRCGQSGQQTAYSPFLWDQRVRSKGQIFMVMGRHHRGAAHRLRNNNLGRPVLRNLLAAHGMSGAP